MKRESNIELLRIIAICGVIILHFNGGVGNAFKYVNYGSMNSICLYFFNSLFACAVNVFVLITGFFMCNNKKINYQKPILLIIQVILFSEMSYLFIDLLINNSEFSLKTFFGKAIPTNYYVILYSALYLLIPFLNRITDNISRSGYKKFITLIFCLFSIYPSIVDCLENILKINLDGLSSIGLLGSQNGYTIVNFILMYYIGTYLRNINKDQFNLKKSTVLLLVNTIFLTFWSYICNLLMIESSAWNYSNPLIIVNACLVFIIFNSLKIKTNYIVNTVSKAAFSVFLFHSYLIPFFNIKYYVNESLILFFIFIIFSISIIYLLCFIVYCIYSRIEKICLVPTLNYIIAFLSKYFIKKN